MSQPAQEADLRVVSISKDKNYGDGFVDTEKRFVIVDADGVIADDAQGYGYKSAQAAHRSMWYKFKGGKDKIATANAVGKNYWRDKKKIVDAIREYVECNFKEISRGEVTTNDIISWAAGDFGVLLDRRMVDWLLKQ